MYHTGVRLRSVVFALNVVALWELTESACRKIIWALPLQCSVRGIKPSKANATISAGYIFTAGKMPWEIF